MDRNALIGYIVFAAVLSPPIWGVSRIVAAKRRARKLREAAAAAGFTFLDNIDPLATSSDFPADRFPSFARRATIRNAMRSDFVYGAYHIFDITPRTGRGRMTVAVIRSELAPLPDFALIPRRAKHGGVIAGAHEPAFFTTSPLAGQYRLFGHDGDALNAMFGGDVGPRVAATPRCGRLAVQGSGPWIVLWEPGKLVGPSDLAAFVHDCEQMTAIVSSRLAGVRLRSKY